MEVRRSIYNISNIQKIDIILTLLDDKFINLIDLGSREEAQERSDISFADKLSV